MDIFMHLLGNLFPLYILIGLGFIAGRWFGVERDTMANFAIYICVPVVTFGFVAMLDFQPSYIILPFIAFFIQALIAFVFLMVGKRVFGDNRANLLALCSAMGNTGYFGLPLVMLLFNAQWVAVYMFIMLGYIVFEATMGYYLAARGNFSVRESLIKLARFPVIYALAAGLLVNFLKIDLSAQFITYWEYFKGAYVIAGMMIIGAALARVPRLMIAPRFLTLSFAGKFLVWPLFVWGLTMFDQHVTRLFEPEIYALLMLMALVPPAANITAFAAQMNLQPEKAATTVLAGTIFALFYIPAMLVFIGGY